MAKTVQKRKVVDPASSDIDEDQKNVIKGIKTMRRKAVEAQKAKAEKILKHSEKNRDDIMDALRDMVKMTHPAKLTEMYTKLQQDIRVQDDIIASAYTDLQAVDAKAEQIHPDFLKELELARYELNKVREDCIEVIEKQFNEEAQAVEIIKRGALTTVHHARRSSFSLARSNKKPRKTDATLVNSD